MTPLPLFRSEKALHSGNPVDSLRALVHDLSEEGYCKPQITALFEQLLTKLANEPACEADADVVRDVLDFLLGWCSPHMKLLREEDDASSVRPR